MSWDHSFDLVIVGSGAAGMSCALHAHELGLKVVVLEASDKFGGSTAMSGGVVWIPDNPQLPGKGITDSRDEALTYLQHIVRGVPTERIEAYVDHSKRMLAWMDEHTHLHLDALELYCDYYPEAPGGKPGGRSMEPLPFDGTELGDELHHIRLPHPQSQVMGLFGITARTGHSLLVNSFSSKLKVLWRLFGWWLRRGRSKPYGRDTRLCAGNALIARLRRSMMDRDIPLWRNTPAVELITEEGRVVGVVAEQDGETMRIRGDRGVLLAAGGFERNQAMREEHQRLPITTTWTAANPASMGKGIQMGVEVGGAVDLMKEAWWTPTTRIPGSDLGWVLVVEKNLPGSFMVNAEGERFCNEAAPYVDVVVEMYKGGAVPTCWLIFDAEYRRLYPVGPLAPGYARPDDKISRKYREGFLRIADSIEELAEKIELDPAKLRATTDRFNTLAAKGKDDDFGRGESLNDTYYGDPRVKPNACLRPLEKGPFYAIPVFAGDLGTKGGLVTDTHARVLDESGQAIPGLYAAGNTSASMMGTTYPGAGGTIGPALTFGFLAAETAANAQSVAEPAREASNA